MDSEIFLGGGSWVELVLLERPVSSKVPGLEMGTGTALVSVTVEASYKEKPCDWNGGLKPDRFLYLENMGAREVVRHPGGS
jgi:hypothetical protein